MKKLFLRIRPAFSLQMRLLPFITFWFTLVCVSISAQPGSTKIYSASDLHFFSPSLLIHDGVSFQTYLAQDRKLIAESKAITEALVKKVKEEKPEIFLVTGDLTKDGEKISHQELAKYLDSIEMNGVTKVYIIPGNHDVNNVDAYSYDGNNKTKVDSVSPADFKTIYRNFGYNEAVATDPASLSYLAKPKSNLWVLGLDACEYDSNMVYHKPVTAGRFKPETYQWALARLSEAKLAGAAVIGMMHHGLTEHFTGQSISFPDYLVAGWDTISRNFANAGLKLMFTGHYHANDITKVTGAGANFVYDIETGSTVTSPCPYRVMNLNDNQTFDITTRLITNINYDTNGKTFQAYAKDYLIDGMTGIVKQVLMQPPYALNDATATAMTPHVVSAYVAHYAGNENMPASEKGFIDYLSANNQALFAGMLTSLWTDLTPSDNNVALDLSTGLAQNKQTIQFIYTSDAHYGITRPRFQRSANVNATVVNAAMITKMNNLPTLSLPKDGGVNEGKTVGSIDFVVMTGDIANRQETPIQSASASWAQFKTDYIDNLSVKDNNGDKSRLLLLPGNHDVSDAIGFYKPMTPKTDSASMVNIYNMMIGSRPAGKYNYANEKIHYSKNIGGIHLMFVCMWPDSVERAWMEADLANVSPTTPVAIFTHDQPAVESKHFTNPNGTKTINATDKFENLLLEVFKDGKTVSSASTIEQKAFALFIKNHPNIVVYFHGNDNQNNYYAYTGPDKNIILNTIQVDSPMKGNISGTDETKLSFQLVSIDTLTKVLTVRECLWDKDTINTSSPIVFGVSKTISLNVAKLGQAHAAGYTVGDFHQHTTFTDGSYTLDYMMSKNNQFGLDWWANSEHGGGFATNGLVSGKDVGKTVYWDSYSPNPIIGTLSMSGTHQNMWRWQSLCDSSFAGIQRNRSMYPDKLILQSYEMNVPGHEHGSMGLIAKQFDYNPNVNPLAQFEFAFDAGDTDVTGGAAQGWTKGINPNNHTKTLEALAWLQTNYPTTSYLIPAHPERRKLYTINHFRDMNNAAPDICFGFESMPGHQKDPGRGGYTSSAFGAGTFGGTGYFSAKVGGLWDAMLSEGRNWWLFASSDCHDASADFYPGEYQKNYSYATDKTNPQAVIDGLRSGNSWVVEGDLIDSLIFTASSVATPAKIAQMGQRLLLDGNKVNLSIKLRDPQGANYNTYSSYTNPVLDHIDIIAGTVNGTIASSDPRYNIDTVATTGVIARFGATAGITDSKGLVSKAWNDSGNGWKEMTLTVDVSNIKYFRLRGSNSGLNVANETDGSGNPLSDNLMGTNDAPKAFADLWFYSNPIFVASDSLLNKAKSIDSTLYTVPSFTLLKRAIKTAVNGNASSYANLQKALSGLEPKATPYNITMSIHGNPSSQLGFAWFTNVGVSGGQVKIVAGNATDTIAFASPLFKVYAKSDSVKNMNYNVSANGLSSLAGIADNSKRSYMSNKALVSGLTPNTTYSFIAGKPGAWSKAGSFTTAKASKDPFSFIYTTDPQAQTDAMFDISQKTTHVAQTMYPNANFWLSCGDLVETSGSANSEWEYEQFFLTQQDIFLKNPFAPVPGNHDKSANRNFTSHFNTDSTEFDYAMSTTPGGVYSYVYGDALFLAISYEDYSVAGYLNSLAKWMRSEVNAHPEVKWRIVYYHKTMYTGSGSHQSDSDSKTVRDRMAPLFDSLKIDLALQGHDHIYELIGPVKNKQLVTGAVNNQITVTFDARENLTGLLKGVFNVKEGTLYFLNNSAGKKKYEPRSKAQMDAAETTLGITNYFGLFTGRFGQTGRPTFSYIKVSTDTITISTYEVFDNATASLFDEIKVVKSSATPVILAGETQAMIEVFPNPVKEILNIRFTNPVRADVEIYNFTGTVVRSEIIEGTTTLNVSNLNPGLYFLKVKAGKVVHVVRFVKE